MNRTYSPECDAWLARQAEKNPPTPPPVQTLPGCPLTDAEFAWLWPRFQRLNLGMSAAAYRLARTPLENLTTRGHNFAIRLAFKHRTQIFGASARKLAHDEFLGAIRTAAAKHQTTK